MNPGGLDTPVPRSAGRSGLILGILLGLSFLGMVMVAVAGYRQRPGDSGSAFLPAGNSAIGLLEIEGILFDAHDPMERLKDLSERDGLKALVVRIDSPGGVIGPTQEIYRGLRRLRDKGIPVVASFGGTAASGGYYIGAAADKIVANPGTMTGSIGVIWESLNLKGVFDKLQVKPVVVKSGAYKDIGNPARDMTETEEKLMGQLVLNLYEQFLEDIAQGRGMDKEAIRPFADGRVFTGAMAKDYGLVDALGNLDDAIDMAAQLAGIEGEPRILKPRRKPGHFMEMLMESGAEGFSRLVLTVLARHSSGEFLFLGGGLGGAPAGR